MVQNKTRRKLMKIVSGGVAGSIAVSMSGCSTFQNSTNSNKIGDTEFENDMVNAAQEFSQAVKNNKPEKFKQLFDPNGLSSNIQGVENLNLSGISDITIESVEEEPEKDAFGYTYTNQRVNPDNIVDDLSGDSWGIIQAQITRDQNIPTPLQEFYDEKIQFAIVYRETEQDGPLIYTYYERIEPVDDRESVFVNEENTRPSIVSTQDTQTVGGQPLVQLEFSDTTTQTDGINYIVVQTKVAQEKFGYATEKENIEGTQIPRWPNNTAVLSYDDRGVGDQLVITGVFSDRTEILYTQRLGENE